MKVVLISTEYPPNIYGGGGIFIRNLSYILNKRKIEVYVLTINTGTSLQSYKIDNTLIYRLPSLSVPPKHLWFQLINLKKIKKIINEIKPDILHANSYSSGIILKYLKQDITRLNISTLVTLHDIPIHKLLISSYSINYGIINYGQATTYIMGYPIWEFLLKEEINLSNKVITVSKFLQKEVKKLINNKKNKTKIEIIYNGINTDYIDYILDQYKRCNTYNYRKDKEIRLLTGGRLFWEKGIILSILIFYWLIKRKKIKNLKLVIFGEGPIKPFLRNMVLRLGLTRYVDFIGFLDNRSLLKLIARSDLLLLPSFYETFSFLLIETLYLGKPVLALKAPYIEEHLKNGLKIETFSSIPEAVMKIEKIIDTKYFISSSLKNKDIIKKIYSLESMGEKYLALYKKLMSDYV